MSRIHHYALTATWTGNNSVGTTRYEAYERRFEIAAAGKPLIPGSADPVFRGDAARWSPEELLIAAVSACHQLWYLHLCADAGIIVLAYIDRASGEMEEEADGSGRFTRIVLRPEATLAPGADQARALALHKDTRAKCFIANSLNFPIVHEPVVRFAVGSG